MDTLKEDFKVNNIKATIKQVSERMDVLRQNGVTDSFDFEMDILTNMPEFYQEYPFLVKKLTSGHNLDYLYKMLDTLEQVQMGNKSFASAEMNLGNELADKYLYPNLKKDKK
jgi:hypothetical protein